MNALQVDKLRPWQIAPAKHLLSILQQYDSAADFSDTGTGKSFVAASIANALALPTLVIAPKISVSMWRSVAAHFNDSFSVINYEALRTGRSEYGHWDNQEQVDSGRSFTFVCQCCQLRFADEKFDIPCFTVAHGIHCVDRKPRPILYGPFKFHEAVKFLIFDECHRCNGFDSLNADLLIAAKRQKIKHLMLSATPAQTILQLKAIGYSLDLFEL